MKHKDMTGQKFGRLTVVSYFGQIGAAQHAGWKCVCECGTPIVARGAYLRNGRISSCGCRRKETQFAPIHATTPNLSKSRAYRIWLGMKSRCEKGGAKAHLYKEKGIRICERWQTPENFIADMGEPPEGMSIDRIDNNRGYEPDNCRWATATQQANNTSANVLLSFNSRVQTLSEWSRELGIKRNTLQYRIRRGWRIDRALTVPVESRMGGEKAINETLRALQ